MINVILPTKGRASSHLPKFLDSLQEATESPFRLVAVVDPKDLETMQLLWKWYQMIIPKDPDHRRMLYVVEQPEEMTRPHLAQLMNLGWEKAPRPCDAWLYCGDDMEFKTNRWDLYALSALGDGYGAFGGADGYMSNEGSPTWMLIADWVTQAAGTFVCPLYAAEGTDKAWADVLGMMGLLWWDPEVLVEHHHSTQEGNTPDATFNALHAALADNLPGHWQWVRETQRRIADAAKIVHSDLSCS